MYRIPRKARSLLSLSLLCVAITCAQLGAFLLRFDFTIPAIERTRLFAGVMAALVIKLTVFYFARLHRGWWTYVGAKELFQTFVAVSAASGLFSLAMLYLFGAAFPRSVYIIDLLLCFLIISGLRLVARLYREAVPHGSEAANTKHVLIYGAGWAGASLLRELQVNRELGYQALGFLDDNQRKHGERILGVRVLGAGRDVVQIASQCRHKGEAIDEVLMAMPSATGRQMSEAIVCCRAAGLTCRTLPGISDLLKGRALQGQVRQVSVGDLLGRESVRLDEAQIWASLANRCVMVTGAAGSIGSELCRQIGVFQPRRLILFDHAESDLFRIDLELRARFPVLDIVAQIGNIREGAKVEKVLLAHEVDTIFHAAAYKHVPLMESHAVAAVENNVIGTYNMARAAMKCGVKTFVQISSDKAVNPTNVMGATKRATELVVSSFPAADAGSTRFVAVRFGNVLGSNGSVVPVFQKQISAGGPVTVTHPEVRRYFMTIPEAAQLVLQASTMGQGSEIFVLDMGELVRIVDLARNMIRLAGLVPDEDIEIRYVGLRPGEKLFEELITEGENILPTHHEKIKIFKGAPASREHVEAWLERLREAIARQDEVQVVMLLKDLIPEYQTSESWASRISQAESTAVACG